MEAGGEFVPESAVAGGVIEWVAYFRYCAGFSDAGGVVSTTCTVAGVREAPRHEVAGGGRRWCSRRYGD